MKFFVVFSAAMALLSPSFAIASNSGDYDADEVYAERRRSPSGGLQAPCNPHSRVKRNGCQSGYYCEAIDGDPNQKGQCIPSPGAGLQDKCNPDDGGRSTCKAGYYCEPIGGDPNQKGQCIPRSVAEPTNVDYFASNSGDYDAGQVYARGDGGLQAPCEPDEEVNKFCQDGYYCEPIGGDPNENGQCIPGGGLQAKCDPDDGSGCQDKYFCEPIGGDPNQKGQCIPGGGLQAKCEPDDGRGSGCMAGYYCEPIIGDPNQDGQCIPGSPPEAPVGEDCGGQRMPSCRGHGRIPMCCPPSRRKARRGKGASYRCVSSSGGMRAQCPSSLEVDASFLEVDRRPPPPPHDQDCGGPEPICGGGSIPMCCASTRAGPGAKASKGPVSRKSFTCVGSSGGMQAQCPTLKVEVSEGCGGFMPTCAAGQVPKCCPYSRGESKMLKTQKTGKAAKGPDPKPAPPSPSPAPEHYICVDSSGGMQAQCPTLLEVDTE